MMLIYHQSVQMKLKITSTSHVTEQKIYQINQTIKQILQMITFIIYTTQT